MTQTTEATKTYYRTGKGSHRHEVWACANGRRALDTGDVTIIPAGEVSAWAACDACCDETTVRASQAQAIAKVEAQCPNSGVTNSKRINSECRDCGKTGKVNRSTGKIKAHKPQAI